MGFWSDLDKFHDKIDPLDAKVQGWVLGEGDPTYGDHKTYGYNGAAYTPYDFAPLANPMTQIQSRYMQQPRGNSLAPMAGYQAGGASTPQMGMYQQYKANPQGFMAQQNQYAAQPAPALNIPSTPAPTASASPADSPRFGGK